MCMIAYRNMYSMCVGVYCVNVCMNEGWMSLMINEAPYWSSSPILLYNTMTNKGILILHFE